MTRAIGLSLLCGLLVAGAGCRSLPCCRQDPPPKQFYVPPPAPAPLVAPPIQQSGVVLPPGTVPVPPPGANVVPPGQAPSMSKSPPERTETLWKPAETREPEQLRDAPPRIQLYAPEPVDKGKAAPEKKPSVEGSFPAIPQFAVAQKNVYAGLRPPLDGLDWLQQKGVQTVVQIRLFGEDDAADRKQVEKRTMRYVPFEISPVTLTKAKADEFVKLIREGAKDGLFVYDDDGSLAGALWYLYMRYGEFLEDDAAQLRARQLGLQINREGQHRDMWLAVQKVLSENSR